MDKPATISPLGIDSSVQLARHQGQLDVAKSLEKKEKMSEAEVDKAAGGFEALLLHKMLQSMWSTVESTGLLGEESNQAQIYRDMLNQAIADSVAEGKGIGVKEFLSKELARQSSEGPKKSGPSTG